MAGIVAGTLNGVAKQANIVPVKVLNDSGSGTNSGIITGIQWAVADAQANNRLTKSVALAGFGGSYSAAVNSAVNAASSAGLLFIVAAGNSAVSNKSIFIFHRLVMCMAIAIGFWAPCLYADLS